MPRLEMKPVREAQLIKATFECIHAHGFTGTTIASVSSQAGVSPGIISHYFGSKDGLLEATMRELLRHLGEQVLIHSKPTDGPETRIVNIINSNFAEQQVSPEAVTVWLAFWGQALHVPELARLQRVNLRRLSSNLRYWLKFLLPEEEARATADALAALIDGLWLRRAFTPEDINRSAARQICLDFLNLKLESQARKQENSE